MPTGAQAGRSRLYTDGVFATATGRAKFASTPYKAPAEAIDARYPFRLNTGRLRDQWHAMSRTGTIAQLYNHAPEPSIALTPDDLAKRGFKSGDLVRVESRRGAAILMVEASDELKPGHAFIAMHWGARFLGGSSSLGVNTLTIAAIDPQSKQPELKHAAVRITAAALSWRLVAVARPIHGSAIALADRLSPLMQKFAFASVVLTGRDREAVLFRVAANHAPDDVELNELDRLLGLQGADIIRYDDPKRAIGRRMALSDDALVALRLSGSVGNGFDPTAAQVWLRDWLVRGAPVTAIRRYLLAPTAAAPAGYSARGQIVCNCFDVSATEIDATLAELSGPPEARLAALQSRRSCGTHCGSSLPELKARVRAVVALQPTAA